MCLWVTLFEMYSVVVVVVVLMSDSSTLNTNVYLRLLLIKTTFSESSMRDKMCEEVSIFMSNFVLIFVVVVVVVLMSWWVILWHWTQIFIYGFFSSKRRFQKSSMRDKICEAERVFMSNFVRDVFCCCCCFDEWFFDIERTIDKPKTSHNRRTKNEFFDRTQCVRKEQVRIFQKKSVIDLSNSKSLSQTCWSHPKQT